MSQTFDRFQTLYERLNQLSRIGILVSWDMYTATPKKGFDDMAKAMTFLSTEAFALATSDEFYDLVLALNEPEEYRQLDEAMQYSVRYLKRDLEKRRRIPKDFYEDFVNTQNDAMRAWEDAKRASDFSIFAPHLEKIIDMIAKNCAYIDPNKDPYEVLLDQFEEGMDSATIDRIFEELKEGLLPLLDQILKAQQPESAIHGSYDPDAQKKVQKLLLEYIGFSFDAGTTAQSEHPFTTGLSCNDVRITNHFYEDAPLSAMFSAIHEGGHGIFEQNVNPAFHNTEAASCRYMGVHESQSRFFENILGRNRNFWIPIYPKIQELLPGLKTVSLDQFYREINHVQNSLIRTEADEVTYCLHIILRYEIEQAIFRDHVPVEELPKLWNQKMKEYLKITPPDDASGILQDVHWSNGQFGYFPSYLLGSIYDGMFLEELEKELGPVDQILADGKIQTITKWLNDKIHQYGSTRLPKDVIRQVCDRELSAKPLLDYYRKKYTELYQLKES